MILCKSACFHKSCLSDFRSKKLAPMFYKLATWPICVGCLVTMCSKYILGVCVRMSDSFMIFYSYASLISRSNRVVRHVESHNLARQFNIALFRNIDLFRYFLIAGRSLIAICVCFCKRIELLKLSVWFHPLHACLLLLLLEKDNAILQSGLCLAQRTDYVNKVLTSFKVSSAQFYAFFLEKRTNMAKQTFGLLRHDYKTLCKHCTA